MSNTLFFILSAFDIIVIALLCYEHTRHTYVTKYEATPVGFVARALIIILALVACIACIIHLANGC